MMAHALMQYAERGMVLPVCYLDSPYIPRVTDLGRESTHPVIGSTMLEALDIWAHHDQRGGGICGNRTVGGDGNGGLSELS